MKIQRAFQPELDLNHARRTAGARHAGAARYAYTWGWARKKAAYRAGDKTPSAIALHRELNARKKTDRAGMDASSKCAPHEALRNLARAFDPALFHWHFRGNVRGDNLLRRAQLKKQGTWQGQVGLPPLKSKRRSWGRFRLTGSLRAFEQHSQLPRLGKLKLKERGDVPTRDVRLVSTTGGDPARLHGNPNGTVRGRLVVADRFFPSSKRHFKCGYVYADLKLSEREWLCPKCGEVVDRDFNAALNLAVLSEVEGWLGVPPHVSTEVPSEQCGVPRHTKRLRRACKSRLASGSSR